MQKFDSFSIPIFVASMMYEVFVSFIFIETQNKWLCGMVMYVQFCSHVVEHGTLEEANDNALTYVDL